MQILFDTINSIFGAAHFIICKYCIIVVIINLHGFQQGTIMCSNAWIGIWQSIKYWSGYYTGSIEITIMDMVQKEPAWLFNINSSFIVTILATVVLLFEMLTPQTNILTLNNKQFRKCRRNALFATIKWLELHVKFLQQTATMN